MADQQDRGLFGMFGKKHEEGIHGQPAPYTEQEGIHGQPAPYTEQEGIHGQPAPYTEQGYSYSETQVHHASPQGYGYGATEVHHAPPTATYSEENYGIAKPHAKQGEEKSHALLGKLHRKNSNSSSSSDEEDMEGGGRKKKGLKEKIKEKLPGHHDNKNKEGEKYGSEEKKHGLFGH